MKDLTCCGDLFDGFCFQDLRCAEPPNTKGVYVIRVGRRGQPVGEIIACVKRLIGELNWPQVGDFVLRRVRRLERIGQCPVIYIGSAGTSSDSRNTLLGRYKEFSGRHTAMYPMWALLYFGWELEFGWLETDKAGDLEAKTKEGYRQKHDGKLPAIVER